MKLAVKWPGLALPLLIAAGSPAASAQGPATPIIVDTAAPIIVKILKPKRDKNDERSIQTFSLSPEAATKMQQVVDKGGFQYGDKVTVYYDPTTRKALKFKGKPSKPI